MLRAFSGGSIFGQSHGSEPVTTLWLHGWSRSARDFDAAAEQLAARGHGSVALDLPGFGSTPAPQSAGGARHYAALLAPVVNELATHGPLVLVGHSFGGRISAVLAAEHPTLVRGVVFTGAPLLHRSGGSSTPPLAYRVIKSLAQRGLVGEQRLEAARRKYGSADYRAACGVMRDVLVASVNESYEAELARITQPCVMVWGTGDRDVPREVAERAIGLMPSRPRLEMVEHCGHLVPTERPDVLVSAALELLA